MQLAQRIFYCIWLIVSFLCVTAWSAQVGTIVVSVHLADPSPPETFYVDINNSGVEDGTSVNPFNTIGEAISAASVGRGDTVIVLPGFYIENIVLKDSLFLVGRDGSFHTFIADAGGGSVVTLANASILRGFSVGDGSASAVDVPTGIFAEVTNCVLYSSDIGLSAGAGATLAFVNNTVDGNASFGVHGASGVIFVTFKNNMLTVNGTGVLADPAAILDGGYNLFFGNATDYVGPIPASTDFADDPLYVDPGNLNFHLKAFSPAREAGDPDPTFDDLDGTRNDLGADGGPQGVQDLLAPLAVATATPDTGQNPLTTTFDGSASTDEWGIATYSWDVDSINGIQEDLTGAVVEHTYTIPGAYIITLTVQDNSGFVSQTTTTVMAGNNLPEAAAAAREHAGMPPFTNQFTGSWTDPDGGPVTFVWDFGDGNTSTEQNPEHTYVEGTPPGDYTVEFRVIDAFGGIGIDTLPITLTDVPVDASGVIAADTGGDVIADSVGSLVAGTVVSIPPGALSNEVAIAIGALASPSSTGALGPAVDIAPNGLVFSTPVTVTIPHPESVEHPHGLTVLFFDENSGTWRAEGIGNIVHIDGSPDHFVQFTTTHFTLFVVGSAPAGGGGGGGGCFIAAAAYGTPMANEIDVLRAVRDDYLLGTSLGSLFVEMYYRVSPPIADVVAQNPPLAALVRLLLVPVIALANSSLTYTLAFALAVLFLCSITAYRRFS